MGNSCTSSLFHVDGSPLYCSFFLYQHLPLSDFHGVAFRCSWWFSSLSPFLFPFVFLVVGLLAFLDLPCGSQWVWILFENFGSRIVFFVFHRRHQLICLRSSGVSRWWHLNEDSIQWVNHQFVIGFVRSLHTWAWGRELARYEKTVRGPLGIIRWRFSDAQASLKIIWDSLIMKRK